MKKVALLALTCLSLTACTFISPSPGSQQKSEPKKTTTEEKTTIVVNYTEPAKKPSKKASESKEVNTIANNQTSSKPEKQANNSSKPVKSSTGVSWNELLGHDVTNYRFSVAKLMGYNFTDFLMNDDGSFTGSYVSRGSVDAIQDPEFKRSDFKGRFEIAEQLDDYSYKLNLVELEVTSPTGKVEQVRDEANNNKLTKSTYVADTPGLAKDRSYILVLKGSNNLTALGGLNMVNQEEASKTRDNVIMEASGKPVFYENVLRDKNGNPIIDVEEDNKASEQAAVAADSSDDSENNSASSQDEAAEIFDRVYGIEVDNIFGPSQYNYTTIKFNEDGTFEGNFSSDDISRTKYREEIEHIAEITGLAPWVKSYFTGKFEFIDSSGDGIYTLKVVDLKVEDTESIGSAGDTPQALVNYVDTIDIGDYFFLIEPGTYYPLETRRGIQLEEYLTPPKELAPDVDTERAYGWTLFNIDKDIAMTDWHLD